MGKSDASDVELKLWLAKRLPEEIEVVEVYWHPGYSGSPRMAVWKGEYDESDYEYPILVNEREWYYVVRMVEEKLDTQQKYKYTDERIKLNELRETNDCTILDSWQEKAVALRNVLDEAA